jgi:membrane-bound ClpP family serine protease
MTIALATPAETFMDSVRLLAYLKRHKMIAEENAYRQGVSDGVASEQERIIKALRGKAATRTVLETLAAPFYIDELIETITDAQDD